MIRVVSRYSAAGKKNVWGSVPSIVELQSEAGAIGAVHGALQAAGIEVASVTDVSPVVSPVVGAVVQAEEKGNPLGEVLRIQASMLRMRRSVMAEEAAAKAAVMLIGPLMLIFGAIMLCLMGPFVISTAQSGMF